MRKIGKWLVPVALVVFVLSVPMVAKAALVWDTTSPVLGNVASITPTGLNIYDAYHGYDLATGTHYFKIDLGPTLGGGNVNTLTGSGTIGSYKIFIDLTPGSGTPYDFVIQYNATKDGSGKYSWNNTGSTVLTGNLSANIPLGQSTVAPNGKTQYDSTYLQWMYIDPTGTGHIGRNFNWWAQTLNGSGTILETTTSTPTPIPNAAWLLGSGIIGLIGLQRRRARKAK